MHVGQAAKLGCAQIVFEEIQLSSLPIFTLPFTRNIKKSLFIAILFALFVKKKLHINQTKKYRSLIWTQRSFVMDAIT